MENLFIVSIYFVGKFACFPLSLSCFFHGGEKRRLASGINIRNNEIKFVLDDERRQNLYVERKWRFFLRSIISSYFQAQVCWGVNLLRETSFDIPPSSHHSKASRIHIYHK